MPLSHRAVFIKDKRIFDIKEGVKKWDSHHALNFKDAVIFPGVIDVHAHLNEPGREDWEGGPYVHVCQ